MQDTCKRFLTTAQQALPFQPLALQPRTNCRRGWFARHCAAALYSYTPAIILTVPLSAAASASSWKHLTSPGGCRHALHAGNKVHLCQCTCGVNERQQVCTQASAMPAHSRRVSTPACIENEHNPISLLTTYCLCVASLRALLPLLPLLPLDASPACWFCTPIVQVPPEGVATTKDLVDYH